jgi:hypothetical protein
MLLSNQKLAPTPNDPRALHYIGGHAKPSAEVSLRTIDPDRFAIINTATGETLEEIEASSAFFEVYDGAVYMHHGRPFLCTKLDLSNRVAHVTPSTVRYYTSPVNHRHVHVVGGHVAYNAGKNNAFAATTARVGQALISLRYSAFVRTARGSQITFGAFATRRALFSPAERTKRFNVSSSVLLSCLCTLPGFQTACTGSSSKAACSEFHRLVPQSPKNPSFCPEGSIIEGVQSAFLPMITSCP